MTANINTTVTTQMTAEEAKAARLAFRAAKTQPRTATQMMNRITQPVAQTQTQAPVAQTRTAPAVQAVPEVQATRTVVASGPKKRIIQAPANKQAIKDIIGNVSIAPEQNMLPSGAAVVRFSVAVRKTEYDADGTLVEKRSTDKVLDRDNVDYYRVNVWGEDASTDQLLDNVMNLELGNEVRVMGIYTTREYDSTKYPGQKMLSKDIRAKETEILLRAYNDGNLVYEAYNLDQQGVSAIINRDAEARFTRQENRASYADRRMQGSVQFGSEIPPVSLPAYNTNGQQIEGELDEGFGSELEDGF